MDIIVWRDDAGRVVALTPAAGATVEETVASDLVPRDRPHFVVDNLSLPRGVPLSCLQVDEKGAITVDEAALAATLVPREALSGDFKRALYELGWYDDVAAAAAAAGGLAKVLWEGASRFERHHPLVVQIATAIGKTSADLDALFVKTTTYGSH